MLSVINHYADYMILVIMTISVFILMQYIRSVFMLRVIIPSAIALCCRVECRYAEWHYPEFHIFVCVVVLSVIMLSLITMSVVAPQILYFN